MKGSHTLPKTRRPIRELASKTGLTLLLEAAQGGWIDYPQDTVTYRKRGREHVCLVVVSVPGFPPGIGIAGGRMKARAIAGQQLAEHVRPALNVCPTTGRDMYRTREVALAAVHEQQVTGMGKPLTDVFKCPKCAGHWHTSGSGATKRKKQRDKNRAAQEGLPWNVKPQLHEVVDVPEVGKVVVVSAEIGLNAPDGHIGQTVAVVLRRERLVEMMEDLEKAES